MNDDVKLLASLGGAGALIGIAKMLSSDELPKARQIVGRAILSGGLGVAAGAAVLIIPSIPLVAQVALACILSSLGVSALEALFAKYVKQ